jgi:hypothetical protein
MVTTWDLGELLKYSLSRLLLHAAPAGAHAGASKRATITVGSRVG